jgi:hypothetical protein
MQYYNAKDNFIMKRVVPLGGASRRVRRGGAVGLLVNFGGGKRPFRKRTCRSKSRCGGGGDMHTQMFSPGSWYRIGGPLRRSRRGGEAANWWFVPA